MNNLTPRNRRAGNGRPSALPLRLRSDWDRLFGGLFDDQDDPRAETSRYPLDLSETEEYLRVRLELPGVPSEAIDVHLEGDVLTLSGEKSADATDESVSTYYTERSYGPFKRTVKLRQPVDSEAVVAKHENGVLIVELRKSDGARRKKIEVQGS